VPLAQLCQELREDRKVSPTLAITFDDGYRDLYTRAFPVLQNYRIPATIYLIGRCMETGEAPWYDRIFVALACAANAAIEVELDSPFLLDLSTSALRSDAAWRIVCYLRSISDTRRREWCAVFEKQMNLPSNLLEDRMLKWDQVKTMHRSGIFFGAHTMTHPSVRRLESAAFHEEFVRSKQLLEAGLGSAIEDFAYPFGRPSDVSPAAQEFLARSGYRSAATTMEGFNTAETNPYLLNRLQIGDDRSISLFAFNVARMFLEGPAPLTTDYQAQSMDQEVPQVLSERGDS
jgi:peptidoglycan/xylan/chitin deacetylase (PgdA/CDA1 family)